MGDGGGVASVTSQAVVSIRCQRADGRHLLSCGFTPLRMRMKMRMRMASFTCKLLTLIFISSTLQQTCGLPVPEQAAPAQAGPAGHSRTKRCSCSDWEDKECIYFCHLDVIWVNTPSKLLPFGLGNRPTRRRRSAERCRCPDPSDSACSAFCRRSSERPKSIHRSAGTVSRNLLGTFRSVVRSNLALANEKQLRSRTFR